LPCSGCGAAHAMMQGQNNQITECSPSKHPRTSLSFSTSSSDSSQSKHDLYMHSKALHDALVAQDLGGDTSRTSVGWTTWALGYDCIGFSFYHFPSCSSISHTTTIYQDHSNSISMHTVGGTCMCTALYFQCHVHRFRAMRRPTISSSLLESRFQVLLYFLLIFQQYAHSLTPQMSPLQVRGDQTLAASPWRTTAQRNLHEP
jgi:hypothetical protein